MACRHPSELRPTYRACLDYEGRNPSPCCPCTKLHLFAANFRRWLLQIQRSGGTSSSGSSDIPEAQDKFQRIVCACAHLRWVHSPSRLRLRYYTYLIRAAPLVLRLSFHKVHIHTSSCTAYWQSALDLMELLLGALYCTYTTTSNQLHRSCLPHLGVLPLDACTSVNSSRLASYRMGGSWGVAWIFTCGCATSKNMRSRVVDCRTSASNG